MYFRVEGLPKLLFLLIFQEFIRSLKNSQTQAAVRTMRRVNGSRVSPDKVARSANTLFVNQTAFQYKCLFDAPVPMRRQT